MENSNKKQKLRLKANTKTIKYIILTNLKMQSKQIRKIKKKISHALAKETLSLKAQKKTSISK